MKKIYEKPSFKIENFETESILDTSYGAFSGFVNSETGKATVELEGSATIQLSQGQILESINYKMFLK